MKKVISLLLALTLIASLVPAAFALEDDGSQIFTFTAKTPYIRNGSNSWTTTIGSTITMSSLSYRRYTSSYNAKTGWPPHLTLILEVEKTGVYEIQIMNEQNVPSGAVPEIYITKYNSQTHGSLIPAGDTTRIDLPRDKVLAKNQASLGMFNFSTAPVDEYSPVKTSTGDAATYEFEAGTYLITFAFTNKSRLANPIVETGKNTGKYLDSTKELIGLSFCTLTLKDGTKLTEADGIYSKLFDAETGDFIKVDENHKFYTKNAETNEFEEVEWTEAHCIKYNDKGEVTTNYEIESMDATIYAGGVCQNAKFSGIKLVPVVNDDPDYVKDFDAKIEENYTTSGKATVDAYTFAGEKTILSANNEVALGETFSVSAPEIEGYNFLYWAKGTSESKLVVSYENELTFKPSEGRNSLIAVYAEESAEVNRAEFYNANGTLIETLTADGKAPEYPSMAGYGNADGWQLYGSETIYGAGEDIAVSGNMIFVAKYPETPGTVIVNGTEYTYGETVTMPELDSSKIFKGWKRNNEIVSTDPNYTFKAYANATVEAVYAENTPVFSGEFMKIVIDSFSAGDETAVMAEFIGMDNAVEKGIMIGDTKKIAMKGNGNQFTILADVPNATYVGYAILKNGTTFTQVIDGAFPN